MQLKDVLRKKKVEDILRDANRMDGHGDGGGLARHLTARDLMMFGIAAIVGAGIFSTIGKASYDGGPGVIFLFMFVAVACSFAAFAYAEFATLVPVSGSAYTYSYVAFGELFAWVIGWALIMEYSIGNITVAISWSDYFTSFINNATSLHIPEWATMDFGSAHKGFDQITAQLNQGQTLEALTASTDWADKVPQYLAWKNAPTLGNMHLVMDIPALVINVLITWLVYRGIKESRNAANVMVLIKLIVVILVIIVGIFYVDTNNWNPFMPNGVKGVLAGTSAVFFAYIGFDAISTTAEECKDPQKDLPKGILYSIVICTILYICVALVLTGMVSYKELNVGDPLAKVFEKFESLKWLSGLIAFSGIIAIASVMAVYQLGQPRVWLTMSRDGLLPKIFSTIHPKFQSPSFATIFTGVMVGLPTLFLNLSFVTDLCSIGTLFAFVLVCAGIIKLDLDPTATRGSFRAPYINAKYVLPIITVLGLVAMNHFGFWEKMFSDMSHFEQKIPFFVFLAIWVYMLFLSITRNLSTIPVLGLLSCLYMMSELGWHNWIGFLIWLAIGLVIYFTYSFKNSKLNRVNE